VFHFQPASQPFISLRPFSSLVREVLQISHEIRANDDALHMIYFPFSVFSSPLSLFEFQERVIYYIIFTFTLSLFEEKSSERRFELQHYTFSLFTIKYLSRLDNNGKAKCEDERKVCKTINPAIFMECCVDFSAASSSFAICPKS
jgi:hypothetical protein